MCICSFFHLQSVYFDLFVYEVANLSSFFFDPETLHLLLEGFTWWGLEGKGERVNVVLVVDHGPHGHASQRDLG